MALTFVMITILLPSLLKCYKLPRFVLRECLFLSFTCAHFVIDNWIVELAH
jgi:hypothetical protein